MFDVLIKSIDHFIRMGGTVNILMMHIGLFINNKIKKPLIRISKL